MAAQSRDLAALQGTWRQVAFEKDGIHDPPDDHGAPHSLTVIEGQRYRVCTAEGDVILEGSLSIDESAVPKLLTWTDDEGPRDRRSLACTYIIEGDRFVFVGAHDGGPRPTAFRTGPGQVMRHFVRVRRGAHDAGDGP